ncbi:glycosyltransferase family 2 protein [Actinomadura barringtoniae]|uniref:Glycosyltransferase family 2 protein n=1 Tax=Actinomadura barringtoniae TaxID=1427535 RepID=A0A939P7P8_9ACTN|nr:glycosyltransferase family 2 protein [Actinomadura barringtoniae]MBO2447185.1 glycosyltransferase family 2 protein [Actinomadura barringtoniae]
MTNPEPPFAVNPREVPFHLLKMLRAHATKRNPPPPAWRRRQINTWQRFEADRLETPTEPLIYGLTTVWNEDDVIYATVRNLFLQGVDEVFVVDDESDDDTVTEAKIAGATLIQDASEGTFEEQRRTRRITEFMNDQTATAGRPVWWIVVDADEFPRGPDGTTIRDLVSTLPPSVDTIGSRVLEHYPSRTSAPLPRHHPLDELRMARPHTIAFCPEAHWKHQMVLLRNPGDLAFTPGRHTIQASPARPIVESSASLLMHHFPLRDRERTEQKFRQAAESRYTGTTDAFIKKRLRKRLRMLELAYTEQYHLLPNMYPGERKQGTTLKDWQSLVPASERTPTHTPGQPL